MTDNPAWTTLEILKGPLYLSMPALTDDATEAEQAAAEAIDSAIENLIDEITAAMISYVANADRVDPDDPPLELKRACALQCAYAWKRRKDIGEQSISFQGGSVTKMSIDEWLPDVEKILKRYKPLYV